MFQLSRQLKEKKSRGNKRHYLERWKTKKKFDLTFPGTYQFSSPESASLGTPLGRIKANDLDVGENAEIEYSISKGEGSDMFDIITDKDTQEGIITIKKVYFSSLSFYYT